MEGIILFSDDHIYSDGRPEAALFESLRMDLPVLGVHNLDLAAKAVKSVASFGALILDWQYSDKQLDLFSEVAEELGKKTVIQRPAGRDNEALDFLKNNEFYTLIYIFSELDIEETYGHILRSKFGNRVKIKRKDENFTVGNIDAIKQSILQDIEQWKQQNKNLDVPISWSSAINESIQKIFKELSDANQNWLKELFDSANHDGIAPDLFIVDLLQLLLSEAVVQNEQLLTAITQIGSENPPVIPQEHLEAHKHSLSMLFSRLFYSKLKKTTPIMTGDVFQLDEETFGVLITPECDVSFISKNEGCEFELLTFKVDGFAEFLKKNLSIDKREDYNDFKDARKISIRQLFNQENSRLHFLPSVPVLDSNGKNSCVIDFRIANRRILANQLIKFPRVIKINSPFIQQLRQRYLAHIGRVGTAALPLHVRDWNLGS